MGSRSVRQLIEKVLFTTSPERVFQPDFGAGLFARTRSNWRSD